ncbi:MAG: MarR family transcriptional regulator [Actinomycetia bacterium]|nr:MarR family transcriptional regulator [Actinomycetes bacterium]
MVIRPGSAVPKGQQSVASDASTRGRVLRRISEAGPITATALGAELALTDTAIRRHLDGLLTDGLIESRDTPASGRRGPGRPAKGWVVSAAGHSTLATDYDELANGALRFLADTVGPAAVTAFAERRVAEVEQRYAAELAQVGEDPRERAAVLVEALTRDGYAASARPIAAGAHEAGPGTIGLQLCQGHCPVQHVAAEFPEFCEAETEAFSRLLGVHVQRLATLAQGDHVCTTFVPTSAVSTLEHPAHPGTTISEPPTHPSEGSNP